MRKSSRQLFRFLAERAADSSSNEVRITYNELCQELDLTRNTLISAIKDLVERNVVKYDKAFKKFELSVKYSINTQNLN
jgi:DNA-binding IclR family transcriptional regulator